MKISELPGDEDSGPTCRTYVFQNESHTLGNALKCIINRYEDVDFCGYTVPHPAETKMHFRIQSRETPALEVLKRGLKDLEKVCDHTISLFEKEVKDFSKMYIYGLLFIPLTKYCNFIYMSYKVKYELPILRKIFLKIQLPVKRRKGD